MLSLLLFLLLLLLLLVSSTRLGLARLVVCWCCWDVRSLLLCFFLLFFYCSFIVSAPFFLSSFVPPVIYCCSCDVRFSWVFVLEVLLFLFCVSFSLLPYAPRLSLESRDCYCDSSRCRCYCCCYNIAFKDEFSLECSDGLLLKLLVGILEVVILLIWNDKNSFLVVPFRGSCSSLGKCKSLVVSWWLIWFDLSCVGNLLVCW